MEDGSFQAFQGRLKVIMWKIFNYNQIDFYFQFIGPHETPHETPYIGVSNF